MKHAIIILLLAGTISFGVLGAEPATGPQPIKPIELKAVPGKRENISIEGEYASFRCIPGNTICYWKIITETQPQNETISNGYNNVAPESFPAIFEPEKVYLGIYDRNNSLRIIEVQRIDVITSDENGSTVIVAPRIELDF
jgi:hypothetical protein